MGDLWARNRNRMPAVTIEATDQSAAMVEAGRSATEGLPIAWTVSAADETGFDDQSFDVVVANHMLYHVPDPATTIAELRRVLRPHGVLVTATNGVRHMADLNLLLTKPPRPLPFTLENGYEMLATSFSAVERRDFPDSLQVTNADLAVAYLESFNDVRDADSIRARIANAISEDGYFAVTKAVGLFLAS
jgi:SAM-dependent methyltransferase